VASGFLHGDLIGNIATMDARNRRALVAAANYAAPQIESFMKSEAPWTDRTGAARSGLRATVQNRGDTVAIVLSHSVPYGVFLEVRWGGKYGVIRQAVAAGTPLFVEAVGKLMFK